MIGATASYVGTLSSFALYYTGGGNVLIEISEFTKCPMGVVLLEKTRTGGKSWEPWNCEKLGRGMTVNATDFGPAKFRGQLEWDDPLRPMGISVRCQGTLEMERIHVRITFAGGIGEHYIRGEPDYTIEEIPDLRDLLTEERS